MAFFIERGDSMATCGPNESGNMETLHLSPIGVVRSDLKTPMPAPDQSNQSLNERMATIRAYRQRVATVVCDLVIDPQWEDLLDGIEAFSHILVLYWPHLVDPARRRVRKIHPMGRSDLPLQGILATCSPARPNPVLVSAVPLVARQANVLTVKRLEAVDGSPIIDVKPYSRGYMQVDDLKQPPWLERIQRELENQ